LKTFKELVKKVVVKLYMCIGDMDR